MPAAKAPPSIAPSTETLMVPARSAIHSPTATKPSATARRHPLL